MNQIKALVKEMEEQAIVTRVFMERVPVEQFGWQPHEKSMTLISLATHVAELPTWVAMCLNTDELDFAAAPYTPEVINTVAELQAYFEKNYESGHAALMNTKETILSENWTMRSGDVIHSVDTKAEVIRMSYNQLVHHRAQLGVYFRLLGVAVPKSFGPTADETGF